MYYAIVACFMFAFPLVSIAIDATHEVAAIFPMLVGKWFVFWSVGVRLVLAGLRQVIQPSYTARVILGLKGDVPLLLVRELGFANLALGLVASMSLMFAPWVVGLALAGGVFYGLAGANHVLQPHRNPLETVAMVSDLFVAGVLLAVCGATGFS